MNQKYMFASGALIGGILGGFGGFFSLPEEVFKLLNISDYVDDSFSKYENDETITRIGETFIWSTLGALTTGFVFVGVGIISKDIKKWANYRQNNNYDEESLLLTEDEIGNINSSEGSVSNSNNPNPLEDGNTLYKDENRPGFNEIFGNNNNSQASIEESKKPTEMGNNRDSLPRRPGI